MKLEQIIQITRAKRSGTGFLGHCPAHDDANPSLSFTDTNGKMLLKCHAGCPVDKIFAALESVKAFCSNTNQEDAEPMKVIKSFFYEGYDGKPALRIDRFENKNGKTFRQFHIENECWVKGGTKEPLRPYRYFEWNGSDSIFLVEGEKCADALYEIGLVSTTTPGGANQWRSSYAESFIGKNIICLPDNDDPGRMYISKASADIFKVSNSIKTVNLPNAGLGEDVFDWIKKGGTKEALLKLSKDFSGEKVASAFNPIPLSDIEVTKIIWTWDQRIPRACITLVEGDGGTGKSTIISRICSDLSTGTALPGDNSKPPINVLLIAPEDDQGAVLRPRFEKSNANLAKVFVFNEQITIDDQFLYNVSEFIKNNRIEVVVIDPIVAFFGTRLDMNKGNDVRSIMGPLAKLARDQDCAVIVVRHFNKSISGSASQRGSGSVDFRNSARSVLQVTRSEDGSYLALEKTNYAASAKTLTFKIENNGLAWTGETDLSAECLVSPTWTGLISRSGPPDVEGLFVLLFGVNFG